MAIAIVFYQQDTSSDVEELAIKFSFLIILLMLFSVVKSNGFSFNLWHWHTNSYSTVAAMIFGYCYGEYNNKYREISWYEKRLLRRGILWSIILVLLGTSSASNIALLSSIVVITMISGKKSLKIFSFMLLVILIFLYQSYGDTILGLVFPGKSVEEVEMMHGRFNLWDRYFILIEQKRWFGWGFAAISRISDLYNIHTHNSFIEILGGIGIFGLVLFVLNIIHIYYRLLTNIHSPYLLGTLGAITGGLINGNSISFIGSPTSGLLLSFITWNLVAMYYLNSIKNYDFDTT